MREELKSTQIKLGIHENATVVTLDDVERLRNRVKHHDIVINKKFAELESLRKDLDQIELKQNEIDEELSNIDINSIKAIWESEKTLESNLMTLSHQLDKSKSTLTQLQKSAKKLSLVPCGDSFPMCMFIKDSHFDKQKILEQETEIHELESRVNESKKAVELLDAKSIKSKIDRWMSLNSTKNELNDRAANLKIGIAKLENEAKESTSAKLAESDKLVELEEAYKRSESSDVHLLRKEVTRILEEIKKFDSMKLESASNRGRLDSELTKLNSDEEKWNKLSSEMKNYELIANAFSKKGIPTKIINSQLPAINAIISEILHGVVDFSIEIEADDDSNALEIYINYGDSRRIIELGSGMEKMFAALAIRVALWQVTSLPKTDMFIIDEGFGVLDESQVEASNRLMLSLKKFFKTIIVITHVTAVKDIADTLIEITRNDKDSKVYIP